jgi:FAD/FMN-containing dehydrogenase
MADTTPSWDSLVREIDGDVALPDSPAYDAARPTFNARFHEVTPKAIVSCASAEDVAQVISFARRRGEPIAPRSGGHSFAGRSSTPGVVIDVTPMRSVSVSDDVATVGAGARLGEVYAALDANGLAIPAGTCPDVGVAGLALGGGLGILGRQHGVTSDRLIGAEIVLADGRILTCDEHHHEDLFWALRGAGAGTFGVVTSLVFGTVPARDATNVHLAWPFPLAAQVIEAWQSWAPDAPDEVAASLKVTATDNEVEQAPSVDVYGAAFASESDASAWFGELISRIGSEPISSWHRTLTFPQTRRFWAHLDDPGWDRDVTLGSLEPVRLFSKTEFFRRPLPADAVTGLLRAFSLGRVSGEYRELDFMPWGGAYARVRSDATAFVHREERFLLKHSTVVEADASPQTNRAAHRNVTRSWESVHPWGSDRAFQNFADPEVEEWAEAHYGTNLDRLRRVKDRYDPSNVFA